MDANYNNVSLLLHGDGADSSTTFSDSSPTPKTVTAVGNAQIKTAQSKFGGSSMYFDGTGDCLTVPSSAAFDFGTGDFTVEAWVYMPVAGVSYQCLYSFSNTNGGPSLYMQGGKPQWYASGSNVLHQTTLGANTWMHVAVCRQSGVIKLFADGVLALTTPTFSTSIPATTTVIGAATTGAEEPFPGYIDDLRVTKGVARYTANFTPPTEAFSDSASEIATMALVSPTPTLSAYTGGTYALTAPSPMFYAGTMLSATVSVGAPSPTLRAFSGAVSSLTPRSPTLYSLAHDSTGDYAAHLTSPSPTLTFTTGAVARGLSAPRPTLVTTGTVTAFARAALKAPKATISATMTVSAMVRASLTGPRPAGLISYSGALAVGSAPNPTLAATVTVGSVARAQPAAPKATLTVNAGSTVSLRGPSPALTSSMLVGGQINTSLSTPSPNLVGYGGAVLSVTTITGKYTLVSSGTTGGIGGAQLECPMFELTAEATAQNYGSANLIAPSPQLGQTIQTWLVAPSAKLTAIGSAVVTATYEAYAVNLKHTADSPDEVTRYTNFPFTHVVRYKNSYYGANSTGLYLLEGATDVAAPIPWAVKTAMTDFKSPVKKTVASAYFAGRFGPASTVALHAGEDVPNTYSFSTPRDRLAQNHRQVFGKGVRERYYALSASGTDVVQLDAVELDVVNTTRRI